MSTTPKVWFITGTSKGFGRIWAEAALKRGDKVVATARNPSSLDELIARYGSRVLALGPRRDRSGCRRGCSRKRAQAHFGRLDVVINNAGFGLFGTVEEVTAEQARAQMETNFFGALWVTKAALPYLREQRSGHIIQVSSIGGVQAFLDAGPSHHALERGRSKASARPSPPRWRSSASTSRWWSRPGTRRIRRGTSSVQATKLPFYDAVSALSWTRSSGPSVARGASRRRPGRRS